MIGPERFRGICSDNTSNTTAARNMIHEDFPWIIILPDACHRLGRLCGDICKLDCYKEVSLFAAESVFGRLTLIVLANCQLTTCT